MADLNKLFMANPPIASLPRMNDKAFASYQQPPRPQSRNLFGLHSLPQQQPQRHIQQNIRSPLTLSTPLRRSQKQLSKTTVQNENMLQQLGYFKRLAHEQFIKKSLTVVVPLLLLGFLGIINGKICFEMILCGVSLLIAESVIIWSPSLKLFFKTLPALTYLALFYDALIQGNHAGNYYVALANLPALIISLAATVNFLFMRKFSFLSQQNLRSVQITSTITQTLKYFYKKYLLRLKNNMKLSLYILTLNFLMAFVFVIYCLVNLYNTLFTQVIYTIPAAVIIYYLIDVYIYSIEFLSRDISLFNLKQKFYQVQVCMSLLRLKSGGKNYQENSKIQQRCLFEITKELKRNRDYLETPVKVNYAINTYRDIFEIYTAQQLSLLQNTINDIVLTVLRNNKLTKSTKSIKEDLFIHLKKLYAKLENNYLLLKILSDIEKRKLIFLIMVRLANDSPLRTKILQTMNDIKQCAKKATSTHEYFEIGQRKLNDWINELEILKRTMSNESVGLRVNNITQKDENGWAHYKRRNILNIQSI